ncbi:MAG TPA: glycoside hydrolase family 30 protein [Flavobacterium sp.]|jgi:glucosylceramidase|nr:glycoside hydrolase family 30 protein [Flavobacterium sp.]HQV34681.1 glycoside hydrolase family 30 protein [Flavobacterium sp.]HQX02714.1 glycoside hydrolase family 30 protein [Flavobacterium sp.]HRZ30741.1 glycoside hydrolase family 30 protein [Flavobacterium sp.]HRZ73652.1 glycoside hydrolase family 30 protein [Flavobacterium sp.]
MKILLSTLMVSSVLFGQTKDKINSNLPNHQSVTVYTTAPDSNLKLAKTDVLTFKEYKQPLETQLCVFVHPNKTNQTFLGIGGAITDASAEVFAKLPLTKQNEFLDAYFDKEKGIGYTLIRTNIHSCDFSSESYTYVEEGDKELKTFSIEHDRAFKIPLIKKAMEKAGKATFYASPWSPPAFMKDSKNMLKGGKLLPEFYQSWANYYVKFVQAYQKENIPVWGLTIQNEPMATQIWESCIFTGDEEREFLKNYLGPTLQKNGLNDVKITVWDHNRDLLSQRASAVLDDPEAAKYVWGIGFHWYENWSGGNPMFENVAKVHQMYPDKNLLFTEGCVEKFSAEKYQFWANGQRYGRSMINDFNNGTVGWTDWNILLDQNGGPNHVGNFCFSPIHGDTSTGELIYTPSYYFIGHFSKFIKSGAKNFSCTSSRSQLIVTSFKNPTGELVTIVMNESDKELSYLLSNNNQVSEIKIPAKAIQTLVY